MHPLATALWLSLLLHGAAGAMVGNLLGARPPVTRVPAQDHEILNVRLSPTRGLRHTLPPAPSLPLAPSGRGADIASEERRAAQPAGATDVGLPLAELAANAYLPARALDVRPVPRGDVAPQYPAHAPRGQLETTTLLVLINEEGAVDDVLIRKPASHAVFDDAARTAFAAARFSPGIKSGEAVKSRVLVEVTFDGR